MAKGEGRIIVTLECTECRAGNESGVSRYTTTKNKKRTPDRLEMKKYCRFQRRHTLHRETK